MPKTLNFETALKTNRKKQDCTKSMKFLGNTYQMNSDRRNLSLEVVREYFDVYISKLFITRAEEILTL